MGDDNPCRKAMADQQGWGGSRCSWDGIVTLRAIKGEDSAVRAEGAGQGGRNEVGYWGDNRWQDNAGVNNQKWLVLNGAWDGDWDAVQQNRWSLEDEIDTLLCRDPDRPETSPAPQPTNHPPGTPAQIYSKLTDLCLHVDSNSDNPNDYTNVDVAACDGSDRQKWSLSEVGEIKHLPSGKCLDADGNNDNEVELYSCSGVAWQKWDIVGKTLRNRGIGRCLDIKNCPDGCGEETDVWVYECYGGDNQDWDWDV